jgi:hypothetical protein
MQAYALSRVLTSMGHELRIVDIRPPWMWPSKEPFRLGLRFKRFKFSRFINRNLPPLTKTYRDSEAIKEDPPISNAYVVGSDQVWNPAITRSMTFDYFLEFVPEGAKRIAYAASFGTEELQVPKIEYERIGSLLEKFDAISVRERSGIRICRELLGKTATHVLDPVFLLEDYMPVSSIKTQVKGLVCYKFVRDPELGETLAMISKLLRIPAYILDSHPIASARGLRIPSPQQWLSGLRQSSFVITDSFHALMFAIIFKKNFIAMPANAKRFGRIEELLKDLDLENRIFLTYEQIVKDRSWIQPIDYSIVTRKLRPRIQTSMNFLKNYLL